jgi:tetratricopeptide (TPR) repeat protein
VAHDDWFRNAEWNSDIEAAFFAKLKRARDKSQYLRVQACTLASTHPRIALRLLDQYFALGDNFDAAQAHVDRATAFLSLGQVEDALASYEAALSVEAKKPNYQTQASLDLPFVIACQGIVARYEQALDLLDRHQPKLSFPVEYFRWHTSRALISGAVGVTAEAKAQARLALAAAEKDHSGFRYHPSVGLVGESYQQIRQRLASLAG